MKATFRAILFWIHLGCGLIAGVIIAIMSATGVAIAFEAEFLDWLDRDVAQITPPENAEPLPLAELQSRLAEEHPEFQPSAVVVTRDPVRAWRFNAGREAMFYVNPYTGHAAAPRSEAAHDFLHHLEEWHRWLGMKGEARSLGRWITGVCNLAFLVLCVTGLYLWWPRRWSWRVWRPALWFVKRKSGKARDFNWHNVIGFWSLPVLVVLVATAVVFSFGWAHDLVFQAAGEAPPKFRDFRMMSVISPEFTPPPRSEAAPLSIDEQLRRVQAQHPKWQAIQLSLASTDLRPEKPVSLTVFEPAPFSTAGRVMVKLDPYSGEELQAVRFSDRSAGLRARVWIRFLHTGEAFGLFGKIIAALATTASLVLVYTGIALSWRRFFRRGKTRDADA